MMCPPSSLNESRIGVLPKFDSLWHTDSEVRVKWWVKLDLSHLLQEKDEFQRMQLYPTVGVGTVHLLHTLWPGSVHMSEPVQLQCPMSQCQIPAQHQCCAVSLWPCTQDRMLTELLLPLHTWLWARGVTSLAVCCCHTHVQTDPQYLTHISVEMHLRHLGSTHVPKCSANHAAVCTAMHLCACCINSVPFR